MDPEWIEQLFSHHELLEMGHGQTPEDLNIGLGWLYYAQVRILRPRHVVCIGSWRGFAPMVLAKALLDNRQGGRLTFIDPSLVDDFWADPVRTQDWFRSFGIDNIEHHRCTTQDFVRSAAFGLLPAVGMLFVDGFHTAEQARFDHEAFMPLLEPDGCVFFHDAVRRKTSRIYGKDRHYEQTVCDYIGELRLRSDLQVMEFPLASGVALVSRRVAA